MNLQHTSNRIADQRPSVMMRIRHNWGIAKNDAMPSQYGISITLAEPASNTPADANEEYGNLKSLVCRG